jgi:hypothetical protein
MARADDTGIVPLAFGAGTIALALLVAAIVWFALPGPDAKHRFVSPSERNVLEIGESCTEAGCTRVALRAERSSSGNWLRHGCVFELAEQRPMLLNAYALWTSDEATVDIVYADADGVGGKATISLDRDCTLSV